MDESCYVARSRLRTSSSKPTSYDQYGLYSNSQQQPQQTMASQNAAQARSALLNGIYTEPAQQQQANSKVMAAGKFHSHVQYQEANGSGNGNGDFANRIVHLYNGRSQPYNGVAATTTASSSTASNNVVMRRPNVAPTTTSSTTTGSSSNATTSGVVMRRPKQTQESQPQQPMTTSSSSASGNRRHGVYMPSMRASLAVMNASALEEGIRQQHLQQQQQPQQLLRQQQQQQHAHSESKPPLPPESSSQPRPPPRTRPKSWTSSLFNAMRNNHKSVNFQSVLEEQNSDVILQDGSKYHHQSTSVSPASSSSPSTTATPFGRSDYEEQQLQLQQQPQLRLPKPHSRTPSPFRTIIKGLVKGEKGCLSEAVRGC